MFSRGTPPRPLLERACGTRALTGGEGAAASITGSTQVAFGLLTGTESGVSLRMSGSSRSRTSRASASE